MWSYDQDGELEDVPPPPPPHFFFGVNLDYLDFSGGIFDLFYEPVREKTNKPACTVLEDGKRLEILDLESRGIVLSM